MIEKEKYWMVHDPNNREPQMRHHTEESAEKEAKRLASVHIGEAFFVLEAVKAFCVEIPAPRQVYLSYPVCEIEEATS